MVGNMSQYDVYKQITLTDHTIDVCEQALNILEEKIKERTEQKTFMAPVLIACLSHDLGKIPDLYKGYSTGDHPGISVQILKGIGLSSESEISQSVLNHHRAVADKNSLVYAILKAADTQARAKELSDFMQSHSSESLKTLQEMGAAEDSAEQFNPDNNNISNVFTAPAEINKANFNTATEYSWLNVNEYLDILQKYINTFEIHDGELKVQSVALSSGIIYLSAFVLGGALTKYMLNHNMSPLDYKENKAEVNKILAFITSKLAEQNLLDTSINTYKGFFSNSVIITSKVGNIIKGFGILVKYQAFGFSGINEHLPNDPELKNIISVTITKEKIK
jgi:hypothetical protein